MIQSLLGGTWPFPNSTLHLRALCTPVKVTYSYPLTLVPPCPKAHAKASQQLNHTHEITFMNDLLSRFRETLHFHQFTCSQNVSPSVVSSKVIRWVEDSAIIDELHILSSLCLSLTVCQALSTSKMPWTPLKTQAIIYRYYLQSPQEKTEAWRYFKVNLSTVLTPISNQSPDSIPDPELQLITKIPSPKGSGS